MMEAPIDTTNPSEKHWFYEHKFISIVAWVLFTFFTLGLFYVDATKKNKLIIGSIAVIASFLLAFGYGYGGSENSLVQNNQFWFGSFLYEGTIIKFVFWISQFVAGIFAKNAWNDDQDKMMSAMTYAVAGVLVVGAVNYSTKLNGKYAVSVAESRVAYQATQIGSDNFEKISAEIKKLKEEYPDVDFESLMEIVYKNLIKSAVPYIEMHPESVENFKKPKFLDGDK